MQKAGRTPIVLALMLFLPLLLTGCPAPEATGDKSLSWKAPVTRSDGTRLYPGEIDGYLLRYRRREGGFKEAVRIRGGNMTRYDLSGLPAGTYEFSIRTVDTAGRMSAPSTPVVVKMG